MATKINTPISYGEHATFGVTTDVIAPYKYQWKRDGVNLSHGNSKVYVTPPLKPLDFRAKYSVQVFGQDKIETSDEVSINDEVELVPSISNHDFTHPAPVAKKVVTAKPVAPKEGE